MKRLSEQLSDFWTVVRKLRPDMDFNTLFPLLHWAWKSWPRPLVPALVNGIPERERLFLLQDPQPATRDEVEELFRCMNLSLNGDLESKMNRIAEKGKKLFL